MPAADDEVTERLTRIERELGSIQIELEAVKALAASRMKVQQPATRSSSLVAESAPRATKPADQAAAPLEALPLPAEAPPSPPPPSARPTRRVVVGPSLAERVERWLRRELTGPRAFAVAGGAVTLLGVIFLFILAANRGWVGPAARVALGATASLAAIAIGVALRVRYGRVVAAFAAVGAGLAGAYATLAAAADLYSYLPSWGALLLAAMIATVGGAIAVAWSSQILAGLALVGAAAAPGFYGFDGGVSSAGTAFALIVLVAGIAVSAPRRWLWLAVTVALVTVAQVAWLAIAAPANDAAAIAVGSAGALILLGGAIAWQAYGGPTLEGPSVWFAFAGGALALGCPYLLIPGDHRLGVALLAFSAVFGATALLIGPRWEDLGWAIGAVALLLAGVAGASLASGRSLTIVWAIEAAVLAALAWKLNAIRFSGASLVYLVAALVHSVALEIAPHWQQQAHDVPSGAAAGLLVLSASSLAVGLLQPTDGKPPTSSGVAAALDPFWRELARRRIELRALLVTVSAIALVSGLAAVLSGRELTIALAALAGGIGIAAFTLGERRLQPFALGILVTGVIHALSVESQLRTLAIGTSVQAVQPVPSLVAVAISAALLAALARFDDRGIRWLGRPQGLELSLLALKQKEQSVAALLALGAATAGCWAAGLLAIDASYNAGQVIATAGWALLGTAVVVLAIRARSVPFEAAGFVYVILALLKAAGFDWEHLGDGGAALSLLVAAGALLVTGFVIRWMDPADPGRLEIITLGAGAVATVAALVALGRWFGVDSRSLGIAAFGVAFVVVAVGVAPYHRWRRAVPEPWLRLLANGYWAIGLTALLFAESQIVLRGEAGTFALWAATAGLLAVTWRPLGEDRVWLAGLLVAAPAALGTLARVAAPSRLVVASTHPATHLWALAVLVAAAWALALTTPPVTRRLAPCVRGTAAALTLYGLSLGVLEIAERLSGASVATNFQRGHTALSTLWGIGALSLYVVGLARERRDLRIVGLTLLGLALAKLFLYDLSNLSSITRALSFLALGAVLLAAGFFAERFVTPGPGAAAAAADPPSGT